MADDLDMDETARLYHGRYIDRIEELEAKLEKAMRALHPQPLEMVGLVDKVLHDMGEPTPPWPKQKLRVFYWWVARAALAELKEG